MGNALTSGITPLEIDTIGVREAQRYLDSLTLISVSSNYRSISLTSVPGKILAKILKEKLVRFLEYNIIISDTQHG